MDVGEKIDTNDPLAAEDDPRAKALEESEPELVAFKNMPEGVREAVIELRKRVDPYGSDARAAAPMATLGLFGFTRVSKTMDLLHDVAEAPQRSMALLRCVQGLRRIEAGLGRNEQGLAPTELSLLQREEGLPKSEQKSPKRARPGADRRGSAAD